MYLYTYNFTKSALLWVGVSQPSHLVCVCGGGLNQCRVSNARFVDIQQ